MLQVKIILGSDREGRFGEKVGSYVESLAAKQADWEVELLDLKEWELPYSFGTTTPKSGNYELPKTKEWAAKIKEADAFIIVTPEYNHGYPAVLKNALDLVYAEWNRKPVAFVGYGAAMGGGRAIEQLRQVIIELEMASTRNAVDIPFVWTAFGEDGQSADAALTEKFSPVFEELSWWANALKAARAV